MGIKTGLVTIFIYYQGLFSQLYSSSLQLTFIFSKLCFHLASSSQKTGTSFCLIVAANHNSPSSSRQSISLQGVCPFPQQHEVDAHSFPSMLYL